jgi:hypothetical protein
MARKDLETVTKSDLAKLVGTTPQAISNALRRGQIFGDAITEDGKLVLEIARQQFEFNRTERGRKKNTEVRPEKPIKKVRDSEDYDWARKQAIAKAKKAEFDALQAELVYRKDAGELIDRQLAVGISYQIAKHLTDSLRNLPDRLAQKTHAAYQAGGNEDDTRETMRLEIDTILYTLSQEVTQFEL